MLTLFLLKRADGRSLPSHDTLRACVVAAENAGAARRIAGDHAGDEGPFVWVDASTEVTPIGVAVEGVRDGLLCRDFVNV